MHSKLPLINQYVLRFLEMMKNETLPCISFHFLVTVALRNRTALKLFIAKLFKDKRVKFESLQFIFCSDVYLLEINKSFLGHDYYTDIITFNLAEKKQKVVGEIYISVDRVRENAITHSEPLTTEILRVIFHGSLHLCGYLDKTISEREVMRQWEDFYLINFYKYLHVPRGTK